MWKNPFGKIKTEFLAFSQLTDFPGCCLPRQHAPPGIYLPGKSGIPVRLLPKELGSLGSVGCQDPSPHWVQQSLKGKARKNSSLFLSVFSLTQGAKGSCY